MPYAPGIQSIGGQLLGQGLMQGLGALAQGIMENATRRRQKEEWGKATATLQPLIDQLAPGAGIKLDKDTPKEMAPQLIQVASHIDQQRREAPLKALQMENEKLRQRISQQELDTAAKNAAAAQAAGPSLSTDAVTLPDAGAMQAAWNSGAPVPQPRRGPNGAKAMSSYLGAGGTDPRMLAQLGDLAQQQLKGDTRGQPGLRNFGTDAAGRPVEGLVDAQGNVKYIQPPKDPKEVAQPFSIGGKQFFSVGSQILDAEGNPVKAKTEKPLDPFAAQALYSLYQPVLAQASAEPKAGLWESNDAAMQRTLQLREQANFMADQLGYAPPFPKVGTRPASPQEAPEHPAAPAAKAPRVSLPYTAAEVQAEMKRRGLVKN